MNLKNNFFTDKECEKIHQMTVKILNEMGCEFEDKHALEVFKKHGAIIEGNIVKIPEYLINKALKSCPEEMIVYGRNDKKVIIGGNNQIIAPASGPLSVLDKEGLHKNLAIDFKNFQKLDHSSKVMDMLNPNLIEPSDIERKIVRDYQMAVCLKYTDKPLIGLTTSEQDTIHSIEMAQKFIGREDNVILGIISVISPCKYDETMLRALRICVERKQPIMIAACSQPGATSPVSLLGTIVVDNAQILAGIIYSQLLRPGAEVMYGNTTGSCDLRFVAPSIGSPETGIFILAAASLAKYYKLPCRTGGSLSDAKSVDWQAGVEATMTMIPSIMSSSNYILHSCGVMDSFNVLSYAKYILDEQNIEAVRHLVKGVDVLADKDIIDEEIENIIEAGVGGQYIQSEHTMEHFREYLYTPLLFNKMGYAAYERSGCISVLDKAYKAVDDRISKYKFPEITKEQEDVLRYYIGDLVDTI